jgi:hypothetical protein
MAEIKTQKNKTSVLDFINSVEDDAKRQDSLILLEIFKKCTGEEPVMWGSSIVGYGSYHYKSERSPQEGDWPMIGFSPRKQNLTIYIMPGFERYKDDLAKLGKHKTSVSCLYINKLADVDEKILKNIITDAYKSMKKQYN